VFAACSAVTVDEVFALEELYKSVSNSLHQVGCPSELDMGRQVLHHTYLGFPTFLQNPGTSTRPMLADALAFRCTLSLLSIDN
jgi:hypothetical protein